MSQGKKNNAGGSMTNMPTVEELAKWNKEEKPALMKAIQQSWAKTIHKVRRMQDRPLYVDKRG